MDKKEKSIRGRGRPGEYGEVIMIRAPAGTKAALDAVLCEGEKQADVLREAIAREIRRRTASDG